jgi:hypothetical protein
MPDNKTAQLSINTIRTISIDPLSKQAIELRGSGEPAC